MGIQQAEPLREAGGWGFSKLNPYGGLGMGIQQAEPLRGAGGWGFSKLNPYGE